MKIRKVITDSGSLYFFQEKDNQLFVLMDKKNIVDNPEINLDSRDEEWRICEVAPWPPRLAEPLLIIRREIPWGEGQMTRTSPVRSVVLV